MVYLVFSFLAFQCAKLPCNLKKKKSKICQRKVLNDLRTEEMLEPDSVEGT